MKTLSLSVDLSPSEASEIHVLAERFATSEAQIVEGLFRYCLSLCESANDKRAMNLTDLLDQCVTSHHAVADELREVATRLNRAVEGSEVVRGLLLNKLASLPSIRSVHDIIAES